MIYFFKRGILPWGKKVNQNLTKNDIVNIRKSIEPSILCKGLPEKFISLFSEVINRKDTDVPDYDTIIKTLISIRDENYNNFPENNFKFKWIRIFKEVSEGKILEDNLKLDKYLNYILK